MAGGPYECAHPFGLDNCMYHPENVQEKTLETNASNFEKQHLIDALANLKNTKVWLYSGTKDGTIVQGLVDMTKQFYVDAGVTDLTYNNDTPAVHAFPSTDA